MSSPLISVITPVFNGERFIRDAIESVLAQSYRNWEMLIVDDGSTDGTAQVIAQYAARDSRIRSLSQPNRGQAEARNHALREARGELAAFLDADDLWLGDKLEICVPEFLAGRQDVLFTDGYIFTDGEPVDDLSRLKTFGTQAATYEGDGGLDVMLRSNRVPMLTVLARREALLAAGGFPGNRIEDYSLWLRMLCEGYVLRGIPARTALYRVHAESFGGIRKNESLAVLGLLRELDAVWPGTVGSRKKIVYGWLRDAAILVRDGAGLKRLRAELDHWKLWTPRLRALYGLRCFLPAASLGRKLRREFEREG